MIRIVRIFLLRVFIGLVLVATSVSTAGALELSTSYMAVQRAFLREDFSKASRLAESYINTKRSETKSAQVWLWWVLSLDRLGRTDLALERLKDLKTEISPDDPLWPEIWYWEGDLSSRAQDMVRARVAYQRLLQEYPDSTWTAQAQLGLGLAYLKQQAYSRAMPYFKNLARQQAGTSIAEEARLFIGICAYQMQRYWETVAVFNALLPQIEDPRRLAQVAFYLGESLRHLDRTDQAHEAYQKAVNAPSDSRFGSLAAFALGWESYAGGSCKEAVGYFDRFLKAGISENRDQGLLAKADCLARSQEPDRAVELLTTLVEEYPRTDPAIEGVFRLSEYWYQQGALDQAHHWMNILKTWSPSSRIAARRQLHLGKLALHEGRPDVALNAYREVVDSGEIGLRQAALSGLGDTYLYLGQHRSAREFFERAAEMDPGTDYAAYAVYQLGKLYLEQEDWGRAKEHFADLLEDPASGLQSDAQLAMGLMALAQNQDILAKEQFRHLIEKQPDSPAAAKARFYLGLLKLDEDREQAKDLFSKTIDILPRSEEAVEARILLVEFGSGFENLAQLAEMVDDVRLAASQRASISDYLAQRALGENRLVEAIRWFDRSIILNPAKEGQSVYHMAEAYEAGGDIPLALNWYQSINSVPWQTRGRFAAAKLFERQGDVDAVIGIYESLAQESIPESKVVQERLNRLYADRKSEKE